MPDNNNLEICLVRGDGLTSAPRSLASAELSFVKVEEGAWTHLRFAFDNTKLDFALREPVHVHGSGASVTVFLSDFNQTVEKWWELIKVLGDCEEDRRQTDAWVRSYHDSLEETDVSDVQTLED